LSDWGDYVDVDGIKFAGRSFSFMPEKRLRDLIEVVHKHGARDLVHCPRVFRLRLLCCYVSTGGYIERVLAASAGNKDVITSYLRKCKNLGFDGLELSSGLLAIPTDDWASLVELTTSHGLKPKPEVDFPLSSA
jgi:phosphosulfolactate synthase (CoM biosynthesis protein A)